MILSVSLSDRGAVVWFTGLSGSGKSTLATEIRDRLVAAGRPVQVLDGDEVRRQLSKDLGYSKADRDTNIARIALVARLVAAHGIVVLVAAISPYADARRQARRQIEEAELAFVEVFTDASLDALSRRDVKGLYARALAGQLDHFTGVSDPYERPEHADVIVHTDQETVQASADRIWALLGTRGLGTRRVSQDS